MGFKEDLAKAKAAVEDRVKTPNIPAVIGGVYYEVVFYRCAPDVWSLVTMQHPPREGAVVDLRNGYDIAGVARGISASCGRVIEDGVETEQSAEEWADFWSVLAPTTARTIEANVWALHEHDTEQEIARAKKASRPRSRRKSS